MAHDNQPANVGVSRRTFLRGAGFALTLPLTLPLTTARPVMVPVMIASPIAVAILIPIPVGVAILTILIIVYPRSVAGRRYVPVRSIWRNAVVAVNVLHALFHADNFAGVVGSPICLPARVVAVKALLIAQRELVALSHSRHNQGQQHSCYCEQFLHSSSSSEASSPIPRSH